MCFSSLSYYWYSSLLHPGEQFSSFSHHWHHVVHTIGMKFISSLSHHWHEVDFQSFTPLASSLFPVCHTIDIKLIPSLSHHWHEVYFLFFTPLASCWFPVFHTIGMKFIFIFSHHWHQVYLSPYFHTIDIRVFHTIGIKFKLFPVFHNIGIKLTSNLFWFFFVWFLHTTNMKFISSLSHQPAVCQIIQNGHSETSVASDRSQLEENCTQAGFCECLFFAVNSCRLCVCM